MEEKIKRLEQEIKQQIDGCSNAEDLDKIRTAYLGRKGELNKIFAEISSIADLGDRKKIGALTNELKNKVE
ncbi:MAG: phenylalanine--tRNA ligase subunit alpha, partial [candidate division WOR-3 bacterium]